MSEEQMIEEAKRIDELRWLVRKHYRRRNTFAWAIAGFGALVVIVAELWR